MKDRIWIVLLALLPFAGCIAGGIGTYHRPEENIWRDGHYVISFELSAPGGNAQRAFTEAFLIVGEQERIEMKIIDASRESVRFQQLVSEDLVGDALLT